MYLSSLLTRYSKTLEKLNAIESKSKGYPLLKIGEAKLLLDRYQRFVFFIKPLDEAMGYVDKKNDKVYVQGENCPLFFYKIKSTLSEDDQKDFVKFVNFRNAVNIQT